MLLLDKIKTLFRKKMDLYNGIPLIANNKDSLYNIKYLKIFNANIIYEKSFKIFNKSFYIKKLQLFNVFKNQNNFYSLNIYNKNTLKYLKTIIDIKRKYTEDEYYEYYCYIKGTDIELDNIEKIYYLIKDLGIVKFIKDDNGIIGITKNSGKEENCVYYAISNLKICSFKKGQIINKLNLAYDPPNIIEYKKLELLKWNKTLYRTIMENDETFLLLFNSEKDREINKFCNKILIPKEFGKGIITCKTNEDCLILAQTFLKNLNKKGNI